MGVWRGVRKPKPSILRLWRRGWRGNCRCSSSSFWVGRSFRILRVWSGRVWCLNGGFGKLRGCWRSIGRKVGFGEWRGSMRRFWRRVGRLRMRL
ncbi:uncharacterized protein MYCFIDRAFT_86978 [Pseudocercospora fijiensis CIRAD86]|uniref:Uncharacterized protein n=1 Tax=Pseudocercospora fijiensis (strain CIRAD86) TaxID=383855 RepID=N1QA25_PSEFD|nr:uncharacterized protein MYCFIDRAFT_86978 [Pseudocercospora fijiensis CIRAD86]EME89775.1 hypothetical protein MYCFIDRAFT_86978 [Pseudocercospora fijiensis CIRAD86]